MNILLYQDDTLNLNLDAVSSGLGAASSLSLNVREGEAKFRIAGRAIRYSKSYKQLSPELIEEAKSVDLCLCFTRIPYDNNYFFHSSGNLVIVSFYAWERLTTLPIENGAVYFVASFLRFKLPLPTAHDNITGCIGFAQQ